MKLEELLGEGEVTAWMDDSWQLWTEEEE